MKYLCSKEDQHCGTCPACARNNAGSNSALIDGLAGYLVEATAPNFSTRKFFGADELQVARLCVTNWESNNFKPVVKITKLYRQGDS